MNTTIREMLEKDQFEVLQMMTEFYSSPAVSTNGSKEIFLEDVKTCLSDSPFLEGYVFECDGVVQGYSMLAKSFSTEFGKPCVWIEDLFLKKQFRGKGIAKRFFAFIFEKYQNSLFKLEVEEDNRNAIAVYKKVGFSALPYVEMTK